MIHVSIPGVGDIELKFLVLDFSGTLAFDGTLLAGVREKIVALSGNLAIHVLTSDTFGRAKRELAGLPLKLHVLSGEDHAGQKEAFVRKLGADRVAAIGNGMNDVAMLGAARLGILVLGGEGAAAPALASSDLLVRDIADALGMLLNPLRLVASLRR